MAKTYDSYKDSGIAWIGEIPCAWKVMPHKRVMKKIKAIQEHYQGEDIISLSMNGVIIRDLDAGGKMPTTFDGYQKVYPGNLLLCLFDIDVTPRCVGLIKNNGVTSPAYSQFEMLPKAYAPYYGYLLRYLDDNKTLLHLSKNLRSSLTEADFGQIYTIQPSLAEQKSIASFLDTKCGEIDSLISLQEEMISELQAYKQSVITEAVTKGLDPNAKMNCCASREKNDACISSSETQPAIERKFKDSGVEWIGEIPETWKYAKLKNIINYIESGVSVNAGLEEVGPNDIGVLKTSSVSKNVFIPYECKKVFENEINRVSCPVKANTIIVSRMNTPELVGACGYVDRDYDNIFLPDRLWQVHFIESVYVKYYWYYLISKRTKSYFSSLSSGTSSSMQNISQPQFQGAPIAVPPLSEQQAIASYLDDKTSQIDSLITLKQQKIDELKDYKKSIIYEYVTGKKRV